MDIRFLTFPGGLYCIIRRIIQNNADIQGVCLCPLRIMKITDKIYTPLRGFLLLFRQYHVRHRISGFNFFLYFIYLFLKTRQIGFRFPVLLFFQKGFQSQNMIAHIVFQPPDITVNGLHPADVPLHIRHLLRQHGVFLFPSVAPFNALIQHDCGKNCRIRCRLVERLYPNILVISIPDIGLKGSQPDIGEIKENQISRKRQKRRCQHKRQLLNLHVFPFTDIYSVYHPDKDFHNIETRNHIDQFNRQKTCKLSPQILLNIRMVNNIFK